MYNVRNDQFLRIIGLRHVQGEEQQKLEVVTNVFFLKKGEEQQKLDAVTNV